MNSSPLVRAIAPLFAVAFLIFNSLGTVAARAAEKSAVDADARAGTELVITNGSFERNGQRVPATLRNVIDALIERYPSANITIVGANDVRINDLTLRWSRRVLHTNEMIQLPLHGVIVALKAASQHRFQIDIFGPNDFVLSGQNDSTSARIAEVFKLGPLLAGESVDTTLQNKIEEAEAELVALKKQFTSQNPRITGVVQRIDVLKQQQSRTTRRPVEAPKLLEQIREIVSDTLNKLRPGEPEPEFKFHPGTSLLVVLGTEDAIDVTRKVVAALQ